MNRRVTITIQSGFPPSPPFPFSLSLSLFFSRKNVYMCVCVCVNVCVCACACECDLAVCLRASVPSAGTASRFGFLTAIMCVRVVSRFGFLTAIMCVRVVSATFGGPLRYSLYFFRTGLFTIMLAKQAEIPESVSVPTECVEAESEGGLGGCCGMIEDEVRVEERGAGKRSVTGRGPRRSLSSCHPRGVSKSGKKKREFLTARISLFLFPPLFPPSPKALPMPWVAVPTLCAHLPAKRRKSLPL